jgi:hypothetical protein
MAAACCLAGFEFLWREELSKYSAAITYETLKLNHLYPV